MESTPFMRRKMQTVQPCERVAEKMRWTERKLGSESICLGLNPGSTCSQLGNLGK